MDPFLVPREGSVLGDPDERPPFFKYVGIALAVGSGVFIGISFVLKKVGLLRANDKYNEVAGEGYGYLKNAYWWGGMSLMILGEVCNFIAYAFTDAILITSLGALSVVITTILSAIFLKERLSMVGKVSCFLCIVGSVIIAINAPQESAVKDIQEMQSYVIAPGFLAYTGVIVVGCLITAFYVGPRWGKRNMLVYISICSWIGGLSVVATQGLGAAIVAWIGGKPQYKEWFMWVLLVIVIITLLVEIVFLNVSHPGPSASWTHSKPTLTIPQKALNIFNAALVTPTYYVYFTSTTIITSAILFQGFKGTPQSIVTVVFGFLTICSGVVLLQLSKSAKDVPDAAVFKGDLDQIQTIAEQEQPETEPKADAIRGTAAIVRRLSRARQKMEADELKRLHEEKMLEAMQPISENGQVEYKWDGLRRRKTISSTMQARSLKSPPPRTPIPPQTPVSHPSPHPPLGMSKFPSYEEPDDDIEDGERHNLFSNFVGTITRKGGRNRNRTNSTLPSYREEMEYHSDKGRQGSSRPVPLTEIPSVPSVPSMRQTEGQRFTDNDGNSFYNHPHDLRPPTRPGTGQRAATSHSGGSSHSLKPPTPPPHGGFRRQFSFNRVFRRSEAPTEEESIGLVDEDGRRDSTARRDSGSGDGSGRDSDRESDPSNVRIAEPEGEWVREDALGSDRSRDRSRDGSNSRGNAFV